jgi:hypothetical protein
MVSPEVGIAGVSDREGGHMAQQRDQQPPTTAMSDRFTEAPPDDVVQEIEEERARRLDPANRPEGAEVDNTHRDFDSEAGMFTDEPGYERLSDEDKPYDDDAGEMKAPDAGSDGSGTGDAEEPTG